MRGQGRILAFKLIEWVALGLIPIFTAVRTNYPLAAAEPHRLWQFIHQEFLELFLLLIIVLTLIVIAAKFAQEYLNPESKLRLKAALDLLLDVYFSGVPPNERYFNRATLFKANNGHSKLKPYCRSGTQYQTDIQPLAISDDDEGHNEGIAGQAWFRNANAGTTNLPECPNPWSDNDSSCQSYARQGLLPMQKAMRLHVKSRSLLATPVRNFRGEKWGVLVLDSRNPDGIDAAKEHLVLFFASTVGKLL